MDHGATVVTARATAARNRLCLITEKSFHDSSCDIDYDANYLSPFSVCPDRWTTNLSANVYRGLPQTLAYKSLGLVWQIPPAAIIGCKADEDRASVFGRKLDGINNRLLMRTFIATSAAARRSSAPHRLAASHSAATCRVSMIFSAVYVMWETVEANPVGFNGR